MFWLKLITILLNQQIDALEDFDCISEGIIHSLVETGFTKMLSKTNKYEAISSIMLNSVILSRKAELDQFIEGLGPVIREAHYHSEIFKPLFVHSEDQVLSPELFQSLLLDRSLDPTMKGYFHKFIDEQSMTILLDYK